MLEGSQRLYNPSILERPGHLLRDKRLADATIGDATFTGLIFLALVLFTSIAFGHWWNKPAAAAPVTYSSTAAKTIVAFSVIGNTSGGSCSLVPDSNCSIPTAGSTFNGNLTLVSDTSTVVGIVMGTYITIGPSVIITDEAAFDIMADYQMVFNGLGGIAAGSIFLEGTVTRLVATGENIISIPFGITGAAGAFAFPVGGEVLVQQNMTSNVFQATVELILVN